MKNFGAIMTSTLMLLVPPAHAERQLLCNPEQQCTVTCYQEGMDNADQVFKRENIETLQIDSDRRVLKIELRQQLDKPAAFDYFILGSEMSCTIENMRGVHD